jgi:hypothetical protein
MHSIPARHQHRHFKTLIVLVLAMTGGTLFLFWLGKLSPATPLRATTWNQILVRAHDSGTDRGFFHFRIDPQGQLYQSEAWQARQRASRGDGAIRIVVTRNSTEPRITQEQTMALSRLVADLSRRFRIASDRVHVDQTRRVASIPDRGEF